MAIKRLIWLNGQCIYLFNYLFFFLNLSLTDLKVPRAPINVREAEDKQTMTSLHGK